MRRALLSMGITMMLAALFAHADEGDADRVFKARSTVCAVELDEGESFDFYLQNGQCRRFRLLEVSARPIYSNLKNLRRAQPDGALVYETRAILLADGERMELRRVASAQEAFYEPWIVNGVRLWFDGAACVRAFITEKHGVCLPKKAARFAFQDAALRLCPERVYPSLDMAGATLPIARIHNGDDTWLGAFLGADAHNGLDVNVSEGTPHYAPFGFDTQFLFESLAAGDDNNRWRGVRTWADGARWHWQVHHLISVYPPRGAPLAGGEVFCEAGGVKYGAHPHSHFFFEIFQNADDAVGIPLDPWMVFWQGFEDARDAAGEIRARMEALAPVCVGAPVAFDSSPSRGGGGRALTHRVWTFGDGGVSHEINPTHIYRAAGVYPVTLTVEDGAHRAATTQYVTVRPDPAFADAAFAFILRAPTEASFAPRLPWATDVYGEPPVRVPFRLQWTVRAPVARPPEFFVEIAAQNTAAPPAFEVNVSCEIGRGADWLDARLAQSPSGALGVSLRFADTQSLSAGLRRARVAVRAEKALNPVQSFEVECLVPAAPAHPPRSRRVREPRQKTVTCQSPRDFYATPYFWIAPQFAKQPQGVSSPYRMSGAREDADAFARFAPDLKAARYRVRFAEQTPFADDARFQVRVRDKNGIKTFWVEPAKERLIGVFEFEEGRSGFVDLLARGARGNVLADAVIFERLDGVASDK